MEFPHIGKHCSHTSCNKLDFLPVKCDACSNIFCHEHMKYVDHQCPQGNSRDIQVPVCPLCNAPVPSKRGEPPDIAVNAHIEMDCQSDTAIGRRKVYTNKCFMKGCKKKELVPFVCPTCRNNFCISHRHFSDHDCKQKTANPKLINQTHNSRPQSTLNGGYEAIQGNMTEDEALAHALALSMKSNNSSQSIPRVVSNGPVSRQRSNNDCNIS